MKKTILLNTLPLTSKKQKILNDIFNEYLRVLNETFKHLPNAKNSNELHHLTYSNIRKTSFLPSDIIQEARKDVWSVRKKIKNGFKNSSIRLNKRWFRFFKTDRNTPCFKITFSPRKSIVIPVNIDGGFQRAEKFLKEGWEIKCISLLKGKIAVCIEKEFPKPQNNRKNIIGIDVGSKTLASLSIIDTQNSKVIKQLYIGKDVWVKQRKYEKRRAKLQSYADKGSEKAKKYLKRLKKKERDFVKTRSGQIAKEIIKLAEKNNASIVIEKLKIRGRKRKFNRKANRKINKIPYGKFRKFLKSNCEMFQIPINEVSAYHTSKWCPNCGAVNKGHSENYALYRCGCGFVANSDRKASLAIGIKSLLERKTEFFQFSKRRVPVNGLLCPDEVGLSSAVHHINQPMESHLTC